jgi:hypothetical protein
MVHALAEMEHTIADGRAQAHLSIASDPGTATEAHQSRASTDAKQCPSLPFCSAVPAMGHPRLLAERKRKEEGIYSYSYSMIL